MSLAKPSTRARTAAALCILSLVAIQLPLRVAWAAISPTSYPTSDLYQHLAVPAYMDPTAAAAAWSELDGSQSGTVSIVVANVDSGPDSQAEAEWTTAIQTARHAGATVLGYVDTGYLGSPVTGYPNGLYTRAGQTGYQAWLPQIEADVNAWYQFYGSSMGGIFFDEGADQCGPTPGSTQYSDEYAALTAYVKQAHPGAMTVLNPGTAVPQCYENSADTLITFEGSYGDYTGNPVSPAEAYQPLSWSSTDPDKFWHIIYGASQSQMEQAMALSKTRNAGYVYVTDDVPANPYDGLPPQAYWNDEQDESYPLGNPGSQPPSTPTGLTATPPPPAADGSVANAVDLSWQPSAGVSAPVVAYDIYEGNSWVASVDANTLDYTVTGVPPSSKVSFSVDARDEADNVSNTSQSAQLTTAAGDAVLPTAPWDTQVTSSSFTTATLSWSPSTASGQSVADYIISQDGAPVLTVPASMTSATVQGLQPGLATYTFSVQAVGSTGDVSPSGNEVTATTTPLPDNLSISTPSAVANADGTITYSADFATPFAFRRAFIATGTVGNPCWTTGGSASICADYLIENSQVLKYAGTGTDFTWTSVDSAIPTLTGADNYAWTIPATDLGSPAGQTVVFNGSGYYPEVFADQVTLGTPAASATALYSADQAPQLSQTVAAAVTAAATTAPAPAGLPAATDPNCPSTADDTWHLGRTDGCEVGTLSVAQSLVDGLLPVTFSLAMTDVVTAAPSGRAWTETVTVELDPVSGSVPPYGLTLTPTCSDVCAVATPVTTTLVPGQPFTAQFPWSDNATAATDFVNVTTAATLVPQLPPLTLPFTPTPDSSVSLGWSTPVLRCDSVRDDTPAACVFPQTVPTWGDLSLSSTVDGAVAAQVAADQQSEPTKWGVQGAGPPLSFTSNNGIVRANKSAACGPSFAFGPWYRTWCDQYPFATTYQGAAQNPQATSFLSPPDQDQAAENDLQNWEAAQHILDGDQYWVQVGP